MKQFLPALTMLFFFTSVDGQDSSFYFNTSDGVRLYVRVAGTGDPCLFLHGGPGLTSYYFEALPVAGLLEKKMKMIYFDQRGGGRSSSARDSNYSIRRMETDIEELRSYLKINQWSVMGHSFGGIIMTAYAKDHPESIRSLLYIHCTLNFTLGLKSHVDNGTMLLRQVGDSFQVNRQLAPFDQLMAVHAELARKGIEYKIMFRSQRAKDIDDSITQASTAHINQDFQHRVWKMKEYWQDFSGYTRDISSPVLIIAGTRDYAVGPDSYKAWQFRNKEVVLYDGAHFSFLEEPAWFADIVLRFLKKE
jgi:proline iminopeptidase